MKNKSILEKSKHFIIDGLDQPSLAGHVRNRHGQFDTGLYTGQMAVDYELHMPRIIQWDEDLWEWLRPITQTDERWGMGLVLREEYQSLSTEEQLEFLVDHFRDWTEIITPFRERWLFRFYDAFVLKAFFQHATPYEAASLLGPCRAFVIIKPSGETEEVTLNELPQESVFRAHPIAPLRMGLLRGLNKLVHDRIIQRSQEHLLKNHPSSHTLSESQLHEFIFKGLEEAWAWNFRNEVDFLRYLSLKAEFGSQFPDYALFPWAKPHLESKESSGLKSRMDLLYAEAIKQAQ